MTSTNNCTTTPPHLDAHHSPQGLVRRDALVGVEVHAAGDEVEGLSGGGGEVLAQRPVLHRRDACSDSVGGTKQCGQWVCNASDLTARPQPSGSACTTTAEFSAMPRSLTVDHRGGEG